MDLRYIPAALLIHLDTSYTALVKLLKQASLQTEEELTYFNETIGALDNVIKQTEEALKDHLHGEDEARKGDPVKKQNQERAEQAFLSQFVEAPEVETPNITGLDLDKTRPSTVNTKGAAKATSQQSFAQPSSLRKVHAAQKNGTAILTTMLNSIVETITRTTHCERGALYLHTGSTPSSNAVPALLNVVRAEVTTSQPTHFPLKCGIPHAVLAGGVGLNAFSKSSQRPCMKELSAQSVLCVPIGCQFKPKTANDDRVSGVLLFTNKSRGAFFSEQDEGLAASASMFVASLLERHRGAIDVVRMAGNLEVLRMARTPDKTPLGNKKISSQVASACASNTNNQMLVKRVIETDEVYEAKGSGCFEVSLANLVKEVSVAQQWMEEEWVHHAGQVADSLNKGETLQSEVAALESQLRQTRGRGLSTESAPNTARSPPHSPRSTHSPRSPRSHTERIPSTSAEPLEEVQVKICPLNDTEDLKYTSGLIHSLLGEETSKCSAVNVLGRLGSALDKVSNVFGAGVCKTVPPLPRSPKPKRNLLFVPRRRPKAATLSPRPLACESPGSLKGWSAGNVPDADTIPPPPSGGVELKQWRKPRPPSAAVAVEKRGRGGGKETAEVSRYKTFTYSDDTDLPPQPIYPTNKVNVADSFAQNYEKKVIRRGLAA